MNTPSLVIRNSLLDSTAGAERVKIMYKLLRLGVVIVLIMLISYLTSGCSDDPIAKVDEPVKITLLTTSPENGGTVPAAGDLRIVFDSAPKSVIVDGIPAIILNNTAFVPIADLPDVIPGTEKAVIIEWRNPDNSVAGAKTITFTVLGPATDDKESDPSNPTTSTVTPPNTGTVTPPSTGRVTPPTTGNRPPPATDVFVNPRPGATLPSNQSFQLAFNQGVSSATVNGVAATGAGANWTVSPFLSEGTVTLNVAWRNRDDTTGSKAVGPYVIRNPDVTSPVIVAGTVRNGAQNVNPAPLNAGGFRFDFDERVTGSIKLTDEAGADLNWITNVVGRTATLTPIAGQELANETTYKIEINVRDGAGNRTRRTIAFVTKPKE